MILEKAGPCREEEIPIFGQAACILDANGVNMHLGSRPGTYRSRVEPSPGGAPRATAYAGRGPKSGGGSALFPAPYQKASP